MRRRPTRATRTDTLCPYPTRFRAPAIHARDRLLTSRERLGAAAEWALGTSPRVTTGVGGGERAITAKRCANAVGLGPGPLASAVARSHEGVADRKSTRLNSSH